MSELIPRANQEAIDYLSIETDNYWTANAVAIGLTAAQVTALKLLIETAQTKLEDALAAREASKNATMALNDAMEDLRTSGSALIATIKAKALADENPTIYTLANIPPPSAGTTIGPAAQPTNLTGSVDNLGNVHLSWKGSLSNGTFFSVWRKVDGETSFTQLGSVVAKTFVDTTIVVGPGQRLEVEPFGNMIISLNAGSH